VVLYFNVDTYDFFDDVIAASTAFLVALFLICMVCHGELVKSKPPAKYLTSFYLSISAGGALGGLFVALVAPQLFKTHFEVALTIIGGFLAGCLALGNDGREGWLKGRDLLQWAGAFLVVGGTFLVSRGNMEGIDPDVIDIERNFYGTVRVEERGDDEERGRYLYNGRIWHGFQYLDPARQLEPTTYYVPGSGAAIAVMEHPRASEGLRVAVIGLGTGSMAAHGKEGDKYIFYDIDPKVVRVAKERFTYLDKSPAKPEVILGDARIQMERELADGPENYDVIVLDAFSGDAIPAHLLTDEAFALYDQHLHKGADGKTPDGVIVIHISNRYLDLEPVVAALAKKYGYTARVVHKDEDGGPLDTASDWVLVSKNQAFFDQPSVKDSSEPLAPTKEVLWTDQFTALVPILK
jgi:SAM-dependent methyltransferase